MVLGFRVFVENCLLSWVFWAWQFAEICFRSWVFELIFFFFFFGFGLNVYLLKFGYVFIVI
jgi:hypothetical protein